MVFNTLGYVAMLNKCIKNWQLQMNNFGKDRFYKGSWYKYYNSITQICCNLVGTLVGLNLIVCLCLSAFVRMFLF